MNMVFFGTDEFAKEILEYLLSQGFLPTLIVTRIDKPKGRSQKTVPSPVKKLAIEKGLEKKVQQPKKASSEEFAALLEALNPELFVVVSYGEILKQNILDIPKRGVINVHPSILPKFRGPSPMQSALLAGESETGVSIMEMTLAMDAGDVLEVAKTPIGENETFGELQKRLVDLAKKSLVSVIQKLITKEVIQKMPQVHEKATFTKKITSESCGISWNAPVKEIHNVIRAFSPRPGARCKVVIGGKEGTLKILRSGISPLPSKRGAKPGEVIECSQKGGLHVQCGSGVLQVFEVQPESKSAMQISAFINGYGQPVFL